MRNKKLKAAAAGSAATVTGIALFLSVNAGVGLADAGSTSPYNQNEHGQTFGSASDAASPDDEPDLILAEATNGRTGYVRKTELDEASGGHVKNPQEALAWQAATEGTDSVVTVYESDGLTEVGVFVIHHPTAAEREA